MTFVESFSYLGACCSFNYDPNSVGNEEHFKTNTFGINGGLNVIGTGETQIISMVTIFIEVFSRPATNK